MSVETQTFLTWPIGDDTPYCYSVQHKQKPNNCHLQSQTSQKHSSTNQNLQSQAKINYKTIQSDTQTKNKKPSGPEVRPSKATRDAVQTFQFEQPINVKNIERARPPSPQPSTSKSLDSELVPLANRFDALEGMEVDLRPPPSTSRGRGRGKASSNQDTTTWGDLIEDSPNPRGSRNCSPTKPKSSQNVPGSPIRLPP